MKFLEMKISIVMVIALLCDQLGGLTLGPFISIAPGVHDAWKQADPENVAGDYFDAKCGNGKIFLVSARLYRIGLEHPWDPASRGGIVSILDQTTNTWSHKPYDRLDEDDRGSKIFSMKGLLFMLTYTIGQKKITFHNLFYWTESDDRWIQVPLDIDPTAITSASNWYYGLNVQVPKQDGNIAYVVTSESDQGAHFANTLEVDINDKVASKATFKPLADGETTGGSFVGFTAVKNDKFYLFMNYLHSDGFESDHTSAYVVDLNTKQVSTVSLSGPAPSPSYSSENMHQTKTEVLIVGGSRIVGIGGIEKEDNIYALNLNTLEWQAGQYAIPNGMGRKAVVDQEGKKLYLIGLKEGVAESKFESD